MYCNSIYSLFIECLFCSSNKNLWNHLWKDIHSMARGRDRSGKIQTAWVLLSMFKISNSSLSYPFSVQTITSFYLNHDSILLTDSNWSWPFPILGPKRSIWNNGSGEAVEDNKNNYHYKPNQYLIHLAYFLTLKGNKVHTIFFLWNQPWACIRNRNEYRVPSIILGSFT